MTFVNIELLLLLLSYFWTLNSALKCYECTAYVPCGNSQNNLANCPGKCMVYKNQYDQGTIVRRCCWSGCPADGMSVFEGRLTYVCSNDMCNGNLADIFLEGGKEEEEGSGEELQSTITTTTKTTTTTVTMKTDTSSMSCHECTGHYSGCGTSQTTIIHNCRMCMVYFNQWDGNTVVRRCCYWNCGPANSVLDYEGRQTYFCASSLCNGIGSESAITKAKGQFIGGDSFPSN